MSKNPVHQLKYGLEADSDVLAIAALAYEGTSHEVNGRTFLPDGDGGFVEAPLEFRADSLHVSSLTGFVGYVEKNLDELDLEKLLVHVTGPMRVMLVSSLSDHLRSRDAYVIAEFSTPLTQRNLGFSWGQYLDLGAFNIALQTLFDASGDRDRILQIVGNVEDGRMTTTADDGVTQTVHAKVGIAKVENAEVPNPVELAPFRTFREVDQVASPFVLRLRSGAGADKVTAALYEADGGAWVAVAIERIVAYLDENLPDGLAVIG